MPDMPATSPRFSNRFVFVGLGNPGDNYARTRHNAGWLALDSLASRWSDPSLSLKWRYEKNIDAEVMRLQHHNHEYIFLKPQTFMNDSGRSALAAVKWFLQQDPAADAAQRYDHLVILHDDLDLVTGSYKLQFGNGPKVHNGVNSVREHLQSDQFWSARLGVDSRNGDRTLPGRAYVLQAFSPDESALFSKCIATLAEELTYTL